MSLINYAAVAVSFIIFLVQFALTLVAASLTVIFSFTKSYKAIQVVLSVWGHLIFLVMGRNLHVYGRHHIQENHNYILLANHASVYDIPAIMAVFPRVSWLGREHLLRIPVFGHALKRTHYIPISRNLTSGTKRIISESVKKAGFLTVAIFPESTRTLDGNLQEFKRGFVHIVNATELDILPVTLNGMFKLKPKNRYTINPFTRLEVIIHQPVNYTEIAAKSQTEITELLKSIIASSYKTKEND